jgi:hypothetical protein
MLLDTASLIDGVESTAALAYSLNHLGNAAAPSWLAAASAVGAGSNSNSSLPLP